MRRIITATLFLFFLAFPASAQGWGRGPIYKLYTPPTTGWIWVNQDGATIAETGGVLHLAYTGVTANWVHTVARVRPAPTPPYKITAVIKRFALRTTADTGRVDHIGVLFRQSSDGKLQRLGLESDPTRTASPVSPHLSVRNLAQANANASAGDLFFVGQGSGLATQELLFFQVEDDGANRHFRVSGDGVNWATLITVVRTSYITPDQVGFFVGTGAAVAPTNVHISATVLSWQVEN
jgi:hypothetical protein